jgi:hypothetical protein
MIRPLDVSLLGIPQSLTDQPLVQRPIHGAPEGSLMSRPLLERRFAGVAFPAGGCADVALKVANANGSSVRGNGE